MDALEPGQFLQGCYFRREMERAVYVVTVPSPVELGIISKWPRIIGGKRKRGQSSRVTLPPSREGRLGGTV